jgi:hypothetical protein
MNNISPEEWGPSAWRFLHYITFSYPDKPSNIDKKNMKTFFLSLQHILPCEKCRFNFSKHISVFPLNETVLNSRFNLINWLINVHNEVNKINGKKIISYDQAINDFLYKKNNHFITINTKYALIISLIIIIFCLVILLKCIN